jgi:cell division protein FtsL
MSQLLVTEAAPEPDAPSAAPQVPQVPQPSRPDPASSDPLVRAKPSAARAAAVARVLGLAPEPVEEQVPEAERHLRLVGASERTPAQRRRRARAVLVGSGVLALGIAFALVYLHVVLAQRQFRLDTLNTQVQQEQLTYQKLRLQVAEEGSPQNIIKTAEGQLGMVQPQSVNWLTPSTTVAPASASTSRPAGANTAPAGDANWPAIKSQLAGSP